MKGDGKRMRLQKEEEEDGRLLEQSERLDERGVIGALRADV